jgi:predicted nucleic acid-binding protein
MTPAALVLDTNVVLDVFVFGDEAAQPVLPALQGGRWQWLATAAMREELGRVLAYPLIERRLAATGRQAHEVLDGFDRHARLVDAPARAPLSLCCSDPDDQKFIDLAVARQACLLSKDRAVLSLRKRLAAWSVRALPVLPALPAEPTLENA